MQLRSRYKRLARSLLMVLVSIFVVSFAFFVVQAGSLSPAAAPASTMNSVDDVYESLVGTFDSSSVVASKQGNALQLSKCIIRKITGSSPCQ